MALGAAPDAESGRCGRRRRQQGHARRVGGPWSGAPVGNGIPWLEHAKAGKGADREQPGRFRVFKSHLTCAQARRVLDASPRTRFVTCLREPHDMARSYFNHMRNRYVHVMGGGAAAAFDARFTLDDFAAVDMLGP